MPPGRHARCSLRLVLPPSQANIAAANVSATVTLLGSNADFEGGISVVGFANVTASCIDNADDAAGTTLRPVRGPWRRHLASSARRVVCRAVLLCHVP